MDKIELSQKQKQYINSATHRWNFKVGATGAGKTFIDILYVIPRRIIERKGQPGLSVIMGVTKETIERNILQPMRSYYGSMVGEINNRNLCRMFGEDVYCLGAEKISQVSKIQGATFKYLYCDEVVKWNEEVFNFAKSRLRTSLSVADLTCNPESPTHFIKKFLDGDADIYNQHYIIDDNPFYPEREKEELKKEYAGTIYWDRYILGLWKQAEGAIYKAFANDPDAFRWKEPRLPNFHRISVGVDFGGGSSNYAWCATGHTLDNSIIALASERHMLADKTPQEVEAMIIDFCERIEEKYGTISYIFPDNAQTSLCVGLRTAIERRFPHISERHEYRKEEIADRINVTVRLMGAGKFWYTDDCEPLKEALEQAMWDKKQSEECGKDVRLDNGTTPIDDLDAFEYSWMRWIRDYDKRLI